MFLNLSDLNTTIYPELIEAISREDLTVARASIDAAISEAKGYLSDFDIETIFSKTGADRHPLLLTFLKDIAVWHMISVSNPSADMQLRKERYERAIDWLKGVQKGIIVPDLPPAISDDGQTGTYRFGSNERRENHF